MVNENGISGLLKGKVAVITGAGAGIGQNIAYMYAKSGADVIIADVNLNAAKETAKQIEGFGVRSLAIQLDVSNVQDIQDRFAEIIDAFERIDILVNNAGIGQNIPIDQLSEKDWDRLIDINLKGVFFCSQTALKYMKEQKSGKIINMASMAGERGGRVSGAHYSASKAGVIVLTKCLAMYGGEYNITANAIAPGLIKTQMAVDLGWIHQEHKDIPLGKLGLVEDVSKAALFLASEMADYISGDTIDVNGGQHMR
jgi:3-oxoacyl-[acyl-carrier protein] reductase